MGRRASVVHLAHQLRRIPPEAYVHVPFHCPFSPHAHMHTTHTLSQWERMGNVLPGKPFSVNEFKPRCQLAGSCVSGCQGLRWDGVG